MAWNGQKYTTLHGYTTKNSDRYSIYADIYLWLDEANLRASFNIDVWLWKKSGPAIASDVAELNWIEYDHGWRTEQKTWINMGAGSQYVKLMSRSIQVNYNQDGTRTVPITCFSDLMDKHWSGNDGGYGWITQDLVLPVIPRFAKFNNLTNSKTINTISFNLSTDVTIDAVNYSLNDGVNWTNALTGDRTNGSFTIAGLNPNTNYSVVVAVRRKDSQLWTNSAKQNISTFDIAKITEANNVTIGNNTTVKYSNPSSGAEVNLSVYIGGTTEIAGYRKVTGTQYAFNFTSTEINRMYQNTANSTYIDLTYHLRTTQNGVHYYSTTIRRFSVNTSINLPTFSDFDWQDKQASTVALTGSNNKIITNSANDGSNVSDVAVIINSTKKAVAKNYATIKEYRVTVAGQQETIVYKTTDVETTIWDPKSAIFTVSAVDSRGLQTTVTKTVSSVDYKKQFINSLNVYRDSGVGTKAFFNIDGKYTNVNFGATWNAITDLSYRTKKKSASTWGSYIKIDTKCTLADGNIKTKADVFLVTADNNNIAYTFDAGVEYDVEFKIVDKLSTIIQVFTLNSGIPCTAKRKNYNGTYSIGVNKFPDTDTALDVDGKINAHTPTSPKNVATKSYVDTLINNTKLDNHPVGCIYQSTSSISPATLFGGTWVALTTRVLVGVGSGVEAGSVFGVNSVTLGTEHTPNHYHTGSTSSGGNHTHGITISSGGSGINRVTLGNWSWSTDNQVHTGTTINDSGNHLHTFTTSSVGGGQAHENRQASRAVYMWYRSA